MSSQAQDLASLAEGRITRPFAGVLRVECTDDDSSFWVDGRGEGVEVGDRAPAEVTHSYCLWRGSRQALRSVLAGQRRLETAYTTGQVSISGDMAVMARMELGDDR